MISRKNLDIRYHSIKLNSNLFRMLACRSDREMRISVYGGFIGIAVILALAALSGFVLYAYYQCCDPLTAGWVSANDQLVPYLAIDLFRNRPGVASLFVVGAYGGTLSSVSSGINSMATCLITDFIQPNESFFHAIFTPSEWSYKWIAKISSLLFGLISIGFTYVVDQLGEGLITK